MLELLALDLVEKRVVTDQIVLTVGYDVENIKTNRYTGEVTTDRYGRKIPKHAHGTANIGSFTSSAMLIIEKTMELYDRIINPDLSVRRVNISANHVKPETAITDSNKFEQLDLLTDYDAKDRERRRKQIALEKERAIQETTIELKNRFGKNAILKGMNLREGATTKTRNEQIGGHKS